MENNTVNTTQATTAEGAGNNNRTFTQEEVDRIVQDRLARERKKNQPAEPEPLDIRERELNERELKFNVKELLEKEKYPAELANILKYKDMDDFKEQYEALKEFIPSRTAPRIVSGTNGGSALGEDSDRDAIRDAMGLK